MSSNFGDDRDKLKGKGRKGALKNVEAPLRDKIVKRLFTKVNELDIPLKISEMWSEANADRAERLDRLQEYMHEYDQFIDAEIDGPFTVAGDLHLPTTYVALRTVHARFMQALFGVDQSFSAKARNLGGVDREQGIQQIMNYYIREAANHSQGYVPEMDKFLWAWAGYGLGYFKQKWERRYRKFIDVDMVEVADKPLEQTDENGNTVLVPQTKLQEKEVERTIKCFDGPIGEYVPEEDLVIIGSDNPQTAEGIIHRQYFTADDLWQLVDQKLFDEEAVKETINAGRSSLVGEYNTQKKQMGAYKGGEADLDKSYVADRYEILEAYLSYDVDGSGINSEIIVWIDAKTRKTLRATYLDRVNRQGRRPISRAVYQPREDSNHPLGLIEMLHPLSKEVDFFHNLRVDFGFISTVPFGFYRPTSNIEAEKLKLEPGFMIPVDNPQTDVYFPNIGNRSSFGAAEEQAMQKEIEKLTSISDLNLGVLTGAQGATRTATGARALLGEASANLDVFLRRLGLAWGDILRYLFSMLQQRMPEGLSFRLLGEDGTDVFKEVPSREALQGNFDFIVDANSASSNKQIQVETAAQVMQLTADPLAIQLGIVTPSEYYEARKNFLKQIGVRDFGKYLRKPQIGPLMSPQEELDRVLAGNKVDILPNMDHMGYIEYWEFVKKDDLLLGQFTEEQATRAELHARAHMEMQQALDQQKAQNMNVQQQAINAAQTTSPIPSQPQAQTAAPPVTGGEGGQ